MRLTKLTLVTSLSLAAAQIHAAPPSFQDNRAMAMGGTGVAGGRPSAASFYNPALLSSHHKANQDGFNLTVPGIQARLADDQDVISQVDDIQDTVEGFNDSVRAEDRSGARNYAERLRDELQDIDEDAMRADAGLGLAIQKPGKGLGIGVFASATLRANVQGDYSEVDDRFLDAVVEGNRDPETISTDDYEGERGLQSSGRAIAAAMAEIGVTLSREFSVGDNALALGISPKFVQLRTFDYYSRVADFDEDDVEESEYETEENHFNMDLGAAYTFGEDAQWVAGASVRNLVPMDIRTVRNVKVEVDPLVTVGLAHRSNWHTLAVDLDLTKNEAFSFEDDTQWLAVGAEFDVFNSLQLRAGARHNIAHDDDVADGIAEENQLTAGVGLSLLATRVDLAAIVADGEVGGGLELGLMF